MKTLERITQVGVIATSLLCPTEIKAAEIPRGASWRSGLEILNNNYEEMETGGVFVRIKYLDGRGQWQGWIHTAEGAPTQPPDLNARAITDWAKSQNARIVCYIAAHNHPPALMKKVYKKDYKSMPPGGRDIGGHFDKMAHSKHYGFGDTYGTVVDGFGVWTYQKFDGADGAAVEEMDKLANSNQWPKKLGSAVMAWLKETEGKASSDVPKLLASTAYQTLVQEYANVGVKITFQSLSDASKVLPCDRR